MARADVLAALQTLEDAEGRITPALIVEVARDPESPLHQCFEWDDSIAAERHRLDQARRLLRLEYPVQREHVSFCVPAYVHDPSAAAGQAQYRSTLKLAKEEDEAHAALAAEFRRVGDALKRARNLAAVFGLENQVAEVEQGVAGLRATLETRGQAPLA